MYLLSRNREILEHNYFIILNTCKYSHLPGNTTEGRFRWPCRLRRGSEVARLLDLWVRIRWEHRCPSVVSVCCQVKVSAMGRSPVQRSPIDCGVSAITNLQQQGGLG